jgi:hypothetical protein
VQEEDYKSVVVDWVECKLVQEVYRLVQVVEEVVVVAESELNSAHNLFDELVVVFV